MNTNIILKKVMTNLSTSNREKFAKLLSTNIELAMPIDFNGQQYNHKQDDKTLFLFLNDKFRIIGILLGRNFDKKHEDFMTYAEDFKYAIQNWKHLQPQAKYILALTPDMRKFSIKKKYSQISKKSRILSEIETWKFYQKHYYDNGRKELEIRLENYKKNKYSYITHEKIMEFIKITNNKLIENLFASEEIQKKIYIKCKKLAWACSPKICDILRSFTNDIYQYTEKKQNFNKYLAKDLDGYFSNNAKEEYEDSKLTILEWYKSIA